MHPEVVPINTTVVSPILDQIRADRSKLTNLGSQISVLVQHYNDLKRDLMNAPEHPTKAQLVALLDQRRVAIENVIAQWKLTIDQLTAKAHSIQGGPDVMAQSPIANSMTAQLMGLGQLVDTSGLQTRINNEQAKLAVVSNYMTQYQAAVSSGQNPPPLPAELQEGFLGMSSGTLIMIAAVLGVGYLLFKGR